jgi:hypothetical protein
MVRRHPTRRNEFTRTRKNLKRWAAIKALLPADLTAEPGVILGQIEDLDVVAVDGEVEGIKNPPFFRGGHDLVYPQFIPHNTVWLDGNYDADFLRYVLYHELVERELMSLGWSYDEAHEYAENAEPAADPLPTVHANGSDDGRYVFVHACPGSTAEDISDLRDSERKISRRTFVRKLAPGQWEWIQRELGYDRHLPISRADWQIPYFKGVYRGVPAVFLVWSAFEYIFTLDGTLGASRS